MMVESDRKNYSYREEHPENELIVATKNWQTNQVDEKNYALSSNHIGKDCTDEEPLLAFEDCMARWATISDPERSLDYRCLTAGRTEQSDAARQYDTQGPFRIFGTGHAETSSLLCSSVNNETTVEYLLSFDI